MAESAVSGRSSKETPKASRDAKILCLTWNVGNAEPDEQQLENWLPRAGGDYDLIVVGTQENKYKHKGTEGGADEPDSDDDDDADEKSGAPSAATAPAIAPSDITMQKWEALVARRIGSAWGLCKLVTLVEMRLAVFARESALSGEHSCIRAVQSARSATGLGSVYGNKGGLVVALTYGQTSLCFVSCHLAAHTHKLAARNADLQEILAETRRSIGNPKLDVASEFDHVVWMGDLNYRLDPNLVEEAPEEPSPAGAPDGASAGASPTKPPRRMSTRSKTTTLGLPTTVQVESERVKLTHTDQLAAVKKLVDEEDWPSLMEMDQLHDSRHRGEAFAGFSEGAIKWAPTFKVKRVRGTEYKDQRVPSYCDRILWKSMPALEGSLELTDYASVPLVSTSDHKPVYASFTLHAPQSLAITTSSDGHGYRLHLRRLQLNNILAADLSGTSDPYCLFYTNPPGLLDGGVPRTPVKYRIPGVGATGGATYTERIRRSTLTGGKSPKPSQCVWEQHELPLLKVNVGTREALERVTLVVALFDRDRASQDDPLGVVWLPLKPQDSSPAAAPAGVPLPPPSPSRGVSFDAASPGRIGATAPANFTLQHDVPIIFGHTLACGGRMRCEIGVSRYDPSRVAKRGVLQRQVTAIEDSAIIEKVRRAEATKAWFVIDPRHSRVIKMIDVITGSALIFTALVTPWEVSFLPTPAIEFFTINRIVDAIFMLDVLLNFCLMYQEGSRAEGRRWVFDPKKIACRYIKGWFTIDVLSIAASAFDVQAFVLAKRSSEQAAFSAEEAQNLYLLRIVRVLRLVKLLRLVRGSRLLKRWQTRISISSSSLQTIQLLVLLLITTHWFSCILALQTAFSDTLDTWLGNFGHCWSLTGDDVPDAAFAYLSPSEPNIGCSDPSLIWLQCAYWALCIITGTNMLPGRGKYLPISAGVERFTDSEMIVLFILNTIGALTWAYILASFVDVITNFDPDTRAFRNSIDSLNRFLDQHGLPTTDPKLCQSVREYFHHSMHLHRAQAQLHLFRSMSPTMQGTIVRQIPLHSKWIKKLEDTLNVGRSGLFRSGDRIRIEAPINGRNFLTHVRSGVKVERQDYHPALSEAVEVTLDLSIAEERVGAAVKVPVKSGVVSWVDGSTASIDIEFFNIDDATLWRRALHVVDGASSAPSTIRGLSTATSYPSDFWNLKHGLGKLFVTEPMMLTSLPPVEDAFLVRVATTLEPMLFAPSELLPSGKMYIVVRGLALLRKHWMGMGTTWGLEMILNEQYTQQYAAHAVSHLEVYQIGRDDLLSAVGDFDNAKKRLRRWAILQSLKSYLLANWYALRSGNTALFDGEGGSFRRKGLERAGSSGVALLGEGTPPLPPLPVAVPGEEQRLGTASGGGSSSMHFSPMGQQGGDWGASDVAGLRGEVSGMRQEMAMLRHSVTQLLLRMPAVGDARV